MELNQLTMRSLVLLLVVLLLASSSEAENSTKFVRKAFLMSSGSNTSKLREYVCFRKDVVCNLCDPYRTFDGTCNNLKYDILAGAAKRPFTRYLPNAYEDGFSVPRGAGRVPPLPNPRTISLAMSRAGPRPSNPKMISQLVMQWGQFVDHDFLFARDFPVSDCCEDGKYPCITDPECLPINVTGDSFYSKFGIVCIKLVRSLSANCSCLLGPREQISELTAFIDGSQVYGNSIEEQLSLRTLEGGRLKVGPEEILTGACPNTCPLTLLPIRSNMGTDAFFGGDERVEEHPGLTSMHTLLLRFHNGLADKMKMKYPNKNDELIFQDTRRIVGAVIQSITFGEFMHIILGSACTDYYDLKPLPLQSGYINYYDDIDPTTPNVLSAAVFRWGHSLIPDFFNLSVTTIALANSFFNHNVTLHKGAYPSDFLREMAHLLSESMDQWLVPSVTNLLYAKSPFTWGLDLVSINIARGRERGIPPYVEWRTYCNLTAPMNFADLPDIMGNRSAGAFQNAYSKVEDIDLFPALIAELPAPGSDGLLGPTLCCLIGEYFHYLKFGDRFFFENNAHPRPFTQAQLDAIESTTLGSLICSFTETSKMQPNAFLVDGPDNPKMNCSQIIPNTVQDQFNVVF